MGCLDRGDGELTGQRERACAAQTERTDLLVGVPLGGRPVGHWSSAGGSGRGRVAAAAIARYRSGGIRPVGACRRPSRSGTAPSSVRWSIDLRGQRRPPLAAQRNLSAPPLVEPGLRRPSPGTTPHAAQQFRPSGGAMNARPCSPASHSAREGTVRLRTSRSIVNSASCGGRRTSPSVRDAPVTDVLSCARPDCGLGRSFETLDDRSPPPAGHLGLHRPCTRLVARSAAGDGAAPGLLRWVGPVGCAALSAGRRMGARRGWVGRRRPGGRGWGNDLRGRKYQVPGGMAAL